MTGSKLTKKDYIKTALRGFFVQNGFNYSNYQGVGYANVLYPALKKHYGDDKEALCKTLEENCEFYNTNPHFLPFITSMHLVMLENDMPTADTRSIKMALMGPLAGIGDSLSQYCIAPLFSTIAASLAMEGISFAPIFFFIAINAVLTTIKLSTGLYGYKLGTTVIDKLSEQMGTISKVANTIGITVISGLAATYVKMNVNVVFTAGELEAGTSQTYVSLQNMLDGIAPKLLPMAYTLLLFYLLKYKKWTTYKLIALTLFIGICGSALGILI